MLSQKNVLSVLRSFKINNYAILDLVASFAGMLFAQRFTGFTTLDTILLTLPVAYFSHKITDTNTPMTQDIDNAISKFLNALFGQSSAVQTENKELLKEDKSADTQEVKSAVLEETSH